MTRFEARVAPEQGNNSFRRVASFLIWSGPPGALEWVCFAFYVGLVGLGIAHHERWFDEAQAWLLARDLPYWDLMANHLRYEGTPGLWQTLLFLAARLGGSYDWVGYLGGGFAVAGAFLLFRCSPFPRLVRCALPFTFFLAYQHAVVARSYNLIAFFLFAIAILYPRRRERPVAVALLLATLSQVSAHALLIAAGLAIHEAASWIRARRWPSAGELAAAAIFATSVIFVVWQLIPPPDLGAAYRSYFGWDRFAVMAGDVIHNAIAEWPFLSELAFAISLYWLWRRGALTLLLIPLIALIALSAFRYHNVWHEGNVFLLWIFALWLVFQREASAGPSPPARTTETTFMTAALLLVCVVQLVWTARTYSYDFRHPYSGSLALARYLKDHDCRGCRIHIDGFKGVAVLPYFDRNIFENLNGGGGASYWMWSMSNPILTNSESVWSGQPDLAIITHWSNQTPRSWPFGFREVARFPGGLYWKNRIFEPDTYILLVREGGRASALLPNPSAPSR
jgi:hypothetical protein